MISVENKIVRRIKRKQPGYCFTAKDFLDIGNRASVDKALSQLRKQGKIRRVCRGIYEYPKHGRLLNKPLPPNFDQVAQAIARNTGTRIQPSGAVAANLLGVTEQVPARIVYLTDGLSRTIHIDKRTITFKRVRPKEIMSNEKSTLVVQALRFIGQEAITKNIKEKIRNQLSPVERRRLIKDAQYSSDWIAEAARQIGKTQNHE